MDRRPGPSRRLAGTARAPRVHLERGVHELRRLRPRGHPGRGLPVPRRRGRHRGGDPLRADRAHPRHLARRAPRRRARPALRLPRGRPLGPRERPPVQPREAAARPVRPRGQRLRRTRPVDLRLHPARQRRRRRDPGGEGPGPQRRGLRRRHAAQRRRARRLRLGAARGPAQGPADRHGRLRAARQGLHPAAQRDPRAPARHVRRPDHPGRRALPEGPRHHHRRAAARAPVRPGAGPRRARPDQLLGLQLGRLLRPAQRLQLLRRPRRAGHRVQAHGQGAARGRARGDPRRGLQPHRRGRPARPDPVLPRPRRPRLLQARRRGHLLATSPAAATPSTPPTPTRCG